MLMALGQLSWWEVWRPPALGRDREWERLDGLLDWTPFERLLAPLRDARRGRPGYPPLALFKALLAGQWGNHSTRSLERALRQSPVLRRFAGFAVADPTPDHSSFSRFHSALAARGLDAALFAELERQLDALGLFRKRATLLDATLLEAQLRRPPYSAGRAAKHPLDPDADWSFSGRGRQSHFGYKAHLGLDLGSLLIRRAELSSAKVYESELAERLICADAGAVYADKAYESKARRAALRRRGIKPRIMHRAHKHQPQLPHWQQVHNRLIGQVRRQVECIFGILKQRYRYRRVGHRGLARNALELRLKCFAYNLRRALTLREAG